MLRHAVVCALLVAAAAHAAGQGKLIKAPWEWTDEERLAARFDPMSIRERAAAQKAAQTATTNELKGSVQIQSSGTVDNVISGKRNPELFMPFELFNSLVEHGFSTEPTERQPFRRALKPVIEGASIDESAFWQRLADAAQLYIENLRYQHQLARRLQSVNDGKDRETIRQQIKEIQKPQCAIMVAALQTASKSLGKATLYRIMYEGVAPRITVSAPPTDIAARYRFIAGGCQ